MQNWQSRFDELRGNFLQRSQERIGTMSQLISSLLNRPGDAELIKELRQHFHWLAGSGGIYGFDTVTRYGLHGEETCDYLLKEALPAARSDVDKFDQLVKLIKNTMANNEPSQVQVSEAFATPKAPNRDRPILLLVESNPKELHGFLRHLEEQNVQVESVRTTEAAKSQIMKRLPDVMIISIPLADGNGYELSALIRSMPGGDRPPIIVISQEGGFLDKVEAIRAGVDAFFEHPVDEQEIAGKIKHLLGRDRPEHYRILSVEDDPDQAAFIKLTLESAGYNVVSLQDATRFEETFLQFEPDMVLLDVMLGTMTGFEIAAYIRQQDRYAALPVVFLTTENALDMHIRSAKIGGDDHLLKPIAPQLLAAAVSGRLEKARVLKKLIERDILTGCLSHGSFMTKALQQMEPDSHRFSLSMLLFDIDHLKEINQRWGFAAGDRVLGSIGPLLLKAFRNCPTIGRIGGNRFAVLLENLDEYQIGQLAHQVVIDFAAIKHQAQGQTFGATIRGAFSAHESSQDLQTWLEATERCLRTGKDEGGNQVISTAPVTDWQQMRR